MYFHISHTHDSSLLKQKARGCAGVLFVRLFLSIRWAVLHGLRARSACRYAYVNAVVLFVAIFAPDGGVLWRECESADVMTINGARGCVWIVERVYCTLWLMVVSKYKL